MVTKYFSNDVQNLVEISNELSDIGSAIGLLSWDQEVMMPAKGAMGRAQQLATLSGIYHRKLISEETRKTLKTVERLSDLNEYDLALIREVERDYEKSVIIPKELVEEISKATSEAYEAWARAKKESDFTVFAPSLEKVLELKIKAAKLLQQPGQSLYDVMLDDYEEGLTTAEIEKVFGEVKIPTVELAKKLSKATRDWAEYPEGVDKVDWNLEIKNIVTNMGYDWEGGRLDPTAHPFESNIGFGDVRITTWKEGKDWKEMIMAAMHEAGHGLYEQGVNESLTRTHLGGGQGLVLHESQSRLWENMVGRSRLFWKDKPEAWWQSLNIVKPSPIRVLADEVTYGLHIILRFEIEKIMINDEGFLINDLPALWNKKMEELLGITPKSDAEGVLQDVHWAHGSFGYFPTYFLGTMLAAQIFRKAEEDIEVIKKLRSGDLKSVREWLREKIHRHGRVYKAKELIKQVTGEDLNPKYFLEYLNNKFYE